MTKTIQDMIIHFDENGKRLPKAKQPATVVSVAARAESYVGKTVFVAIIPRVNVGMFRVEELTVTNVDLVRYIDYENCFEIYFEGKYNENSKFPFREWERGKKTRFDAADAFISENEMWSSLQASSERVRVIRDSIYSDIKLTVKKLKEDCRYLNLLNILPPAAFNYDVEEADKAVATLNQRQFENQLQVCRLCAKFGTKECDSVHQLDTCKNYTELECPF